MVDLPASGKAAQADINLNFKIISPSLGFGKPDMKYWSEKCTIPH